MATLVRPRSERPFCINLKVFHGLGEKAWGLAALVGHEGRLASLAGLVSICTPVHFSRFDPKVPQFSRYYPRVRNAFRGSRDRAPRTVSNTKTACSHTSSPKGDNTLSLHDFLAVDNLFLLSHLCSSGHGAWGQCVPYWGASKPPPCQANHGGSARTAAQNASEAQHP